MKVTIDKNGVLTISAENGLEAYALRQWSEHATVISDICSEKWGENGVIRCSRMLIQPLAFEPPQVAECGRANIARFHNLKLP